MRPFNGSGHFENPFEWQMVDNVATMLNTTVEELNLGRDQDWIKEVIREAAVMLPESIIEGQQSDYLAEYILGLSAARNSLVVASYCFRFLKGQNLIDPKLADDVDAKLEELEVVLASVTDQMRENLASGQGQHSNN